MDGVIVGLFGSEAKVKESLSNSLGKKSEAEGVIVHHRTEAGRRISFLDTLDFPERIRGYSRIASISDAAMFVYPTSGKVAAADGELAVLLGAFKLNGSLELVGGGVTPDWAKKALSQTVISGYLVDERSLESTSLSAGAYPPRQDWPEEQNLVYVDRVFPVKGVGTVALGFVLCGSVKAHDRLTPLPTSSGPEPEVRSIQVNDQDFLEVGRGLRVGLSLKGPTADDLGKCAWLTSPGFPSSEHLSFKFEKSLFYKQELASRDGHLQLPGELVAAHFEAEGDGVLRATLPFKVPVWDGMRVAVVDLNAKNLRIAGGGTCIL